MYQTYLDCWGMKRQKILQWGNVSDSHGIRSNVFSSLIQRGNPIEFEWTENSIY